MFASLRSSATSIRWPFIQSGERADAQYKRLKNDTASVHAVMTAAASDSIRPLTRQGHTGAPTAADYHQAAAAVHHGSAQPVQAAAATVAERSVLFRNKTLDPAIFQLAARNRPK